MGIESPMIISVPWKRLKAFLWLRLAVLLGLMLTLLHFFRQGNRLADFVFFGILGLFWFGLSLLVQYVALNKGKFDISRQVLFAMIDVYVIVSSLSFVDKSSLSPVCALGAYGLLVTAICGPVVGGVSIVAGILASLNAGLYNPATMLSAVTAGATALVCGAAWHVSAPFLWKAVQHARTTDSIETVSTEPSEPQADAATLGEMQERLAQIARERDQSQDRVMELEKKLKSAGNDTDTVSGEGERADSMDDIHMHNDRIVELESELEQTKGQLAAAKFENDSMTSELASISKELETAYGGGDVEDVKAEPSELHKDEDNSEIAAAFAAVAEHGNREDEK